MRCQFEFGKGVHVLVKVAHIFIFDLDNLGSEVGGCEVFLAIEGIERLKLIVVCGEKVQNCVSSLDCFIAL